MTQRIYFDDLLSPSNARFSSSTLAPTVTDFPASEAVDGSLDTQGAWLSGSGDLALIWDFSEPQNFVGLGIGRFAIPPSGSIRVSYTPEGGSSTVLKTITQSSRADMATVSSAVMISQITIELIDATGTYYISDISCYSQSFDLNNNPSGRSAIADLSQFETVSNITIGNDVSGVSRKVTQTTTTISGDLIDPDLDSGTIKTFMESSQDSHFYYQENTGLDSFSFCSVLASAPSLPYSNNLFNSFSMDVFVSVGDL